MTLATILFVCIACSASAQLLADLLPPAALQASQDQTSQKQSTEEQSGNAGTHTQTQTPSALQTPSPSPGTATPQKKKATSKRWKHKKKATANGAAECPPATSAGGAAAADGVGAGASSNPAPPNQAQANPSNPDAVNPSPSNQTPSNQAPANPVPANPAAAKSGASKAPPSADASTTNCPPSKTVVREGGISEQTIQLVGGNNPGQAAQQRSTTDQLLGSTEDNLKKVAGRQLNSSQQDTVNQIQEFMEQSKAALSAGDTERGHKLALKAHLLSDELVKP